MAVQEGRTRCPTVAITIGAMTGSQIHLRSSSGSRKPRTAISIEIRMPMEVGRRREGAKAPARAEERHLEADLP